MQEVCRQLQEFLTSHGIPNWLVVFIISVCPILECRLGMFTAIVLLRMNPFVGFIISFLGNILPIPFILLLINLLCIDCHFIFCKFLCTKYLNTFLFLKNSAVIKTISHSHTARKAYFCLQLTYTKITPALH